MHVVIFEGTHWRHFAPLTLSRPVFCLACGTTTLLEKQVRATAPTKVTLWVRPGLEDYCRRFVVPTLPCPADVNTPLGDEPVLLLSGRTLHIGSFEHPGEQSGEHPGEHSGGDSCVVDETPSGPVLRQAWVTAPGLGPQDVFDRSANWLRLLDLPHTMPQSRLPEYIWDLIGWNEEAIVTDFIAHHDPSQPKPPGPYHVINDANLWLGTDVKLNPGCVLDGSRGPVILSDHCVVGANAVLQGPCFVGPHTQIAPLTSIRHGTTIGAMCKVGGEVSNSILLGYTNKAHEGFLGDSYVGEWVNLGAGTTTSNLKNTYGEISMPVDQKMTRIGRKFLGSLIGDHTKTAIGTRLMTGTYVGYSCMLAGSTPPPSVVPSFSYITDKVNEPYRLDKAVGTMKEVFNRRHRKWTAADDEMNQYIARTSPEVESLRKLS